MAILKDCSSKPSCEVELNIKFVNDESVKFRIDFSSGPAFPEVNTEIACLKRDFLKLLDDLQHIPEYGTYHFPGYGLFQMPEQERQENEPRIKLIFVLDAGEKNHFTATGCGPALCLIVKMEQIKEFVDSLKMEVNL